MALHSTCHPGRPGPQGDEYETIAGSIIGAELSVADFDDDGGGDCVLYFQRQKSRGSRFCCICDNDSPSSLLMMLP